MPDLTCTNCGKPLEAEQETSTQSPCPACGSTARTEHKVASDTLSIRGYERTDIKQRERGKVVREERVGDDFHYGKWNLIRRVVDRANNWYEKIVRDRDTGKITYQNAEPLDEHRSKSNDARA